MKPYSYVKIDRCTALINLCLCLWEPQHIVLFCDQLTIIDHLQAQQMSEHFTPSKDAWKMFQDPFSWEALGLLVFNCAQFSWTLLAFERYFQNYWLKSIQKLCRHRFNLYFNRESCFSFAKYALQYTEPLNTICNQQIGSTKKIQKYKTQSEKTTTFISKEVPTNSLNCPIHPSVHYSEDCSTSVVLNSHVRESNWFPCVYIIKNLLTKETIISL